MYIARQQHTYSDRVMVLLGSCNHMRSKISHHMAYHYTTSRPVGHGLFVTLSVKYQEHNIKGESIERTVHTVTHDKNKITCSLQSHVITWTKCKVVILYQLIIIDTLYYMLGTLKPASLLYTFGNTAYY